MGALEVEPELGCGAKIPGQPQRCIGGNGAMLLGDLANAGCWDAQRRGKGVGRQPQGGHEFFAEDFTGMGLDAHDPASMVVGDLDAVRGTITPDKAQPPLVIDADAVLALPVALQSLKAVPWR
jgi:hypothetical protein